MSWAYKDADGRRIGAARDARQLTEPCKQFLRTCTGDELMREIRAMLNDQPIEIVDAIAMLDYLCELRDGNGKSAPPSDVEVNLSRDAVARVHAMCLEKGLPYCAQTITRMAQALGLK